MSIRTKCSAAMRMLLEDPKQRIITQGPEGIFTELDIIFLAARGERWADDEERERWMRMVQREAAEVARFFYNDGQAARFGPVMPPGAEHPDYARIASKIVYTPLNGRKSLKTPNGIFPRVLREEDAIRRTGRRLVTARDDLERWESIDNANTKDKREIARLKAEVAALQARVRELETENDRMRQRAVQSDKEGAER